MGGEGIALSPKCQSVSVCGSSLPCFPGRGPESRAYALFPGFPPTSSVGSMFGEKCQGVRSCTRPGVPGWAPRGAVRH